MSLGIIDKAMLEVERAMPAGFALTCLGWRNGVWIADARPVMTRGFRSFRETTGRRWHGQSLQADGLTPQEALSNLSDVLDAFRENMGAARKHDGVDAIITAVFGTNGVAEGH